MGNQPLYDAGDTPENTRYRGHRSGIARYTSNGSWELLPSCSSAGHGVTMIASGRCLYLIGGSEGYRIGDGKHMLRSTFDRFDPGTGQWTSLTLADDELQDAVRNGPHKYIAPAANHIFVSYMAEHIARDLTKDRARERSFRRYWSYTSWWYDCERCAWKRGAPMPTPREHIVLPLGSGIFALGDGLVEACQPGPQRRARWSIYEDYEDSDKVTAHVATLDGQKIFLLGVAEGGKQFCRVQCFTPDADGGVWGDLAMMPSMDVAAAVAVPAWRGLDEDAF
ncbi:unnamed protein product [Prorocentrum cordatum]|uniref:Uncharacterized protein n=1 Tax=Prorocentrum cordatum TaxID=2364126 RepID=A0ABN9QJY3_9DINO|nr:unnamed protein product [Polarella glacialis]